MANTNRNSTLEAPPAAERARVEPREGSVSTPPVDTRRKAAAEVADRAEAAPRARLPLQLPLLQHSVCALLARGSMLVARGVGVILISRQLGPAQFGVYALLLVTFSISLSLGTFGLEQTNLYHVGRRPRRVPRLVGNSLLLGATFGTTASLLFLGAVTLLHERIFVGAAPQTVLLCALALPFGIIHNGLAGLVVGLGRFKYYGAVEVAKWTAYLGSVTLLYATHRVTVTLALACFFGLFAAGALSHLIVLWTSSRSRPRFSRRQLLATLRLGRSMLSVHLCNVLSLRLDVYAVRTFAGSAFVGKYALASQLSEILLYLARSMALVVFSSAARSADARRMRLRRLLLAVVGATLLVCASLLVGGERLLHGVLGENAHGGLQVLLLRLPGVVMIAILLVLYGDLLGRGRSDVVLRGNALGVVLLAVLAWPLAAINPAVGAAAAFTIAALAQLAWIVPKYRRRAVKPGPLPAAGRTE